jgi:hypothetical protein
LLIVLVLGMTLQTSRAAEPPQFAFPASCQLGATCWVVNYVDVDAATGRAADFRCGMRTYDGHDGTDFAVRDGKAMQAGVDVLAAADGTVLRIRDGVADREPSADDIKDLLAGNRACGNGVLIEHGSGWQTIYCHMKQGSIGVTHGARVRSGDVLGKIGQSGAAEFPHLHFGVMHEGKKVDPFTGAAIGTAACGTNMAVPMWQPTVSITYSPFSLYGAGFASGAPDFERIKQDATGAERLRREGLSALSFWIAYLGAARGDRIRIEVIGPDKRSFASRDIVQDGTRARQFYFIGRKAPSEGFAPGAYIGRVMIQRDGKDPLKSEVVKQVTLE